MVQIDTVLLKVASRCNIDCTYCYVYKLGDFGWSRQPKLMSQETSTAIADQLSQLAYLHGHSFAIVLHGGEPLLLGKGGLEHLVIKLRNALPSRYSIGIQTNGTLLTTEIVELCYASDVTISLSLDGPRHVHDRNRVGFDSTGTFDRVLAGLDILRSHPFADQVFAGILAVVDPTSDPSEVYSFFRELDIPSLDFIYKDGNHSRLPSGKTSFSSTEYGIWMKELFKLYVSDPKPIQIRLLDDLVKSTLGGSGTKEGVGLTDYAILTIDTDGSITKNDTLKSSYDGADRFAEPWSVHSDRLIDIVNTDVFREAQLMQRPQSSICLQCDELAVCGGGMPLHRWSDDTGYCNPSIYCADQKVLIEQVRSFVSTTLSDCI